MRCHLNSHNGKFSYGYASSPGKRSSMEDFYETRIDGVEGEIVGLFGVFDGSLSLSLLPFPQQNSSLGGQILYADFRLV